MNVETNATSVDWDAPEFAVSHASGIITVTDANTTLGYCRYGDDGEVEYLFVQSARRRQGLAMRLLALVEQQVGGPLRFREPLSPTGRRLVDSYFRTRPAT